MKKILTLTAALMVVASVAMAQTGLNFFLGDCASASTSHTLTNACTSNSGTLITAIGSVVMPAQTIPGFVGAATVIDVQTSTVLPDYWRGDACRSGATSFVGDANNGGSCATIWDGHTPAGSSFVYQYGTYEGSTPSRIRINAGTVMSATDVYDLTGDGATETSVFKLTISKSKSTGTGACAGCATGACIVLNEINFQPLVGGFSSWLRITNPVSSSNFITYQNGAPTCAASTPTQNRSWGSVKALYR